MKPSIEFISDFKQSGLVEHLCSEYTVVMIWLSGSNAIELTDMSSDYDLGVLVADPVIFSKEAKTTEFYRYKKDNKEVHCIYNSFDDIKAKPCEGQHAPYRHLGWAQFRYIKPENLIYINPKYEILVTTLMNNKICISENAMNTFIQLLAPLIQVAENVHYISAINWGKMLSHLCWCIEELRGLPHDRETLIALKRIFGRGTIQKNLPPIIREYVAERLTWARDYLKQPLDTLSEVSQLIDTIIEAYGT